MLKRTQKTERTIASCETCLEWKGKAAIIKKYGYHYEKRNAERVWSSSVYKPHILNPDSYNQSVGTSEFALHVGGSSIVRMANKSKVSPQPATIMGVSLSVTLV